MSRAQVHCVRLLRSRRIAGDLAEYVLRFKLCGTLEYVVYWLSPDLIDQGGGVTRPQHLSLELCEVVVSYHLVNTLLDGLEHPHQHGYVPG